MKYPLDTCIAQGYSVPMSVESAVRPPLPRRGHGTIKRPGRSPDMRPRKTNFAVTAPDLCPLARREPGAYPGPVSWQRLVRRTSQSNQL
jgi:hypothetical protein